MTKWQFVRGLEIAEYDSASRSWIGEEVIAVRIVWEGESYVIDAMMGDGRLEIVDAGDEESSKKIRWMRASDYVDGTPPGFPRGI